MPATHTKHLRLRPNAPAPEPVEPPPVEVEEFEPWMKYMVFDTAGACRFLGNCSEAHLHRLRKKKLIYAEQDGPGCRLNWPFLSLMAYRASLKRV